MHDQDGFLPPENETAGIAAGGSVSSRWSRRGNRSRKQAAASGATPVRTRVPKRHRWLKRTGLVVGALVVVCVSLAGAGWFYLNYRLNEVPAIHGITGLKATAKPGDPFNVLLVGSDSRAWCTTQACWDHFGNQGINGGQRSDVIIILRVIPAKKTMEMLSIPRDTWVTLADSGGQSNRINAAFNSGPDQLIATIEQDFSIPINYFAYTTFPGFSNAVTALGGVYLDFPDPVRDSVTGLHIRKTGCQFVNGVTALELVRSRDLSYFANGQWTYDGLGDLSRIRRQEAFFHAVIERAHSDWNLIQLNNFLGQVVNDVAVDAQLKPHLRDLGLTFRNVPPSALTSEVIPTEGAMTTGGADILVPAWRYDRQMIRLFLADGVPSSSPSGSKGSTTSSSSTSSTSSTTTTMPPITGTTSGPIFDNQKHYPEPWDPTVCNP